MAGARKGERLHEPAFPNLTAMKRLDREEHVRRAMAGGMTRAQAEEHADEELADPGA